MANSFDVAFSPSGNTGTSLDEKGFVSGDAVRPFTVQASNFDAGDTEVAVRTRLQALNLIPREGDPHPSHFLYRCESVTLQKVGPLYYEGQATYAATPRPQNETEDETVLPWQIPTELNYATVKSEEPTDIDADGNPIRNNGTDEPIEGITRQVSDQVIIATKAFINYEPAVNYLFYDSVNDAAFLGFPAGTVKLDDIDPTPSYHDNQLYYKVTTKFVVRKPFNVPAAEAWYKRLPVRGFYEFNSALNKVIRAVDDENKPVSTPVYLDKDTGVRIPVGDPIQFRTVKIYESKDFSQLGY